MISLRPFVALLFAFLGWTARADPLPTGPGRVEFPNGTEPITLFTYKPPTYTDGPLLVVCHGVQRNAEDYRNFAITLAERYGVIVVAPLFDTARFPSLRYQRGGLLDKEGKAQPPEAWTYAIIPKIVAQAAALVTQAWETRRVEQRRDHDHAVAFGERDSEIAVVLGVALHAVADDE